MRTEAIRRLQPQEAEDLRYLWPFWARENQLPPETTWEVWLLLAGRGFGKTRVGAEETRRGVATGEYTRIALVSATPADIRDVMIEGESGILAVTPQDKRPTYEPSKRRLTWPNGAMALAFSSYEPDQLRGPQFDFAWCDELGKWKYPQETWDNLELGLRLGGRPRAVITTTPKPIKILKDILREATTATTRGSTYENRANLAASFLHRIVRRYEGTRTGLQEIYAQLLEEAEGALWTRSMLEATRVVKVPELRRIVVAIDPAVTSSEQSDETGIVAAGVGAEDGHGYILRDASGRYSPEGWAKKAIDLYHELDADRIVAEANNGGDMVALTLKMVDKTVPVKLVHASKGKAARAEPVVSLYEQGRVHHVGMFPELEDQLCTWEPNSGDKSPDRLDALVWDVTELIVDYKGRPGVRFM